MAPDDLLPLFPLGTVLLPGMPLPLHIFEDRYRQLVVECLEQRRAFGIVFYEAGRLAEVGCMAQIRKVLRRYPDGRLDILVTGGARFRIVEVHEDGPYPRATVEPLRDQPAEGPRLDALAARGVELLAELGGLLGRPVDASLLRNLTPEEVSFQIAAVDGFPVHERQRLLEMTSTTLRLSQAVQALQEIIGRVRQSLEVQRLIGGNGHIKEAFRK